MMITTESASSPPSSPPSSPASHRLATSSGSSGHGDACYSKDNDQQKYDHIAIHTSHISHTSNGSGARSLSSSLGLKFQSTARTTARKTRTIVGSVSLAWAALAIAGLAAVALTATTLPLSPLSSSASLSPSSSPSLASSSSTSFTSSSSSYPSYPSLLSSLRSSNRWCPPATAATAAATPLATGLRVRRQQQSIRSGSLATCASKRKMMGDMESGQFTPHKIHDIAEPGQPIMHEQGQPQRSRQQQQQQKQQQQQHSTITVGKQKQKRGTASALKMRSKSVFAEDLWVGVGVGVLTGTAVVIFSSVVHILQEAFGVVSMSPSAISDHATGPLSNAMIWAEQKGVQALPQQVRCLVTPVLGGIISTAILALFSPPLPPASVEQVRGWIERGVPESDDDILPTQQQKQQEQQHVDVDVDVDVDANRARGNLWRASLSPSQRIAAAAVVLATGNSLGPEGPSVEIGRAWAKLLSSPQTLKAALAAGMAAGVSAGFDAPISGVLFALETSKQSSSGNSQDEPDQISMSQDALAGVVVAAVVAAVASRLGLGEAPALFAIPRYQLGAYFELPFYAGLGALCGAASLAFLSIEKKLSEVSLDAEGVGVPGLLLPSLASLVTGLVALSYPEVMYQGFANFDKILGAGEANASGTSDAYTAAALLQIATAKVFVTALSRSFGLQGGIYAPSLFIGAALGLAFGTFSQQFLEALISNLGVMLSAPQTYALAGMAATLAAVCRIPLTASLLLFEITRDYEIMLPILVAVAVSFGSSTTAYSIMENSDSVFDADDGLDGSIEPSSTNPEKIEVESERFKA